MNKEIEKKGLKLPNKSVELTTAQKEVLHLLTDEFLTIKQIAQQRHCSLQAVYKIVAQLKKKGYDVSSQDFDLFRLDSFCYFCDFSEFLDKHHIVEKKYKGLEEKDNYLFLCPNCHRMLHYKGVLSYKKGFYYMLNRNTLCLIMKPSRRQIGFPRNQPIASFNHAIKMNKINILKDKRNSKLKNGKFIQNK